MDYRTREARELAEVTPRNSNDVEEIEGIPREPALSSQLAVECQLAVEWEPTLRSELAQQCEISVEVEASTPTLRSELGKRCEIFVKIEDFELKSPLGRACAMEVASEAGSSSDDESEYESEDESESDQAEPDDGEGDSYLWPVAKEPETASAPHFVVSKLSSREATELARKRLLFA